MSKENDQTLVAKRLELHLNTHRLPDSHQSAYRTCQSTETVLPNVHRDIAESLDSKCVAASVLPDLSAAFNVISHEILQKCLEYSFVVTGSSLSCLDSVLFQSQNLVCVKVRASVS